MRSILGGWGGRGTATAGRSRFRDRETRLERSISSHPVRSPGAEGPGHAAFLDVEAFLAPRLRREEQGSIRLGLFECRVRKGVRRAHALSNRTESDIGTPGH